MDWAQQRGQAAASAGAVREMRRALAPGGRAAIATWAGRERQPHFDAIATALREHVGEEAADARRHRATPEGGVACDMTALVALAT